MKTYQEQKVSDYLQKEKLSIFIFAKEKFLETKQRGFVVVVVKNDTANPFKEGILYYITEQENSAFMANIAKTEQDLRLEKDLAEYNPLSKCLIQVWYKTDYKIVKMTDTGSWN